MVLPVVRVAVDEAGALTVDVDGQPRAADRRLGRADLGHLLDEITAERACAVRVEVQEADRTTYADIATPRSPGAGGTDAADSGEPRNRTASGSGPRSCPQAASAVSCAAGVRGTGFEPGEPVAVAYLLAEQRADAAGHAVLRLPPALATRRARGLVLLGCRSHRLARIETAEEPGDGAATSHEPKPA